LTINQLTAGINLCNKYHLNQSRAYKSNRCLESQSKPTDLRSKSDSTIMRITEYNADLANGVF